MRGAKVEAQRLFSYLSPEQRVPQDHPLRAIRAIVDRSLAEMDTHFSTMYSTYGRPSIPPEFLLRALLLQVFYSVRSEHRSNLRCTVFAITTDSFSNFLDATLCIIWSGCC